MMFIFWNAVYKMSEEPEYRCFIGGLAWATSDRSLKEAFDKYGKLVEAKVCICFCYVHDKQPHSFSSSVCLFVPC